MKRKILFSFLCFLFLFTSGAKGFTLPDTTQSHCYYDNGSIVSCELINNEFPFEDGDIIKPNANLKILESSDNYSIIYSNTTGIYYYLKKDFNATYNEAKDFCENLNAKGYSWELPSMQELQYLVNVDKSMPASDVINLNTYIWSSNKDVSSNYDLMWTLYTYDGSFHSKATNNKFPLVICSYNPNKYPNPRFIVQGNTVLDKLTGLRWDKNGSTKKMIWKDALQYCKNLVIDNYTTWRMPNIFELSSIIDFSTYAPSIFPEFNIMIDNMQWSQYWSSTSSAPSSFTYAWGVNFFRGELEPHYKDKYPEINSLYVRCVYDPSIEKLDNNSTDNITEDNNTINTNESYCLNSEDIKSLPIGWSIIGSSCEITDFSIFNIVISENKYTTLWQWDNINKKWNIWTDNENLKNILNDFNIQLITKIHKKEGFWIYISSK